MEALINKTSELSNEMIIKCLTELAGKAEKTEEELMVEDALVDVYGEREGWEKAEALIDTLSA